MELAAAMSGDVLVAALLLARQGPWKIPFAAIITAFVALVPIVQHGFGNIFFLGDAWLASMYVAGFSAAIVAGAEATRRPGWQPALFFAFGLASTLSVGIELKQWLNLGGLYGWTRDMAPGDRPYANIGQPNNLATLLCWGLISTWWAYHRTKIRGVVASLLAAYLLFGLALTQSRTGWAMVTVLLLSSYIFRGKLETERYWKGLAALAILFASCVLAMDMVGRAVGSGSSTVLSNRLTAGYRLLHWKLLSHAILSRPWSGWGWNQVSVAQQAASVDFSPVPELLGYSHDLIIDLLLWNGIPLGVIITIGVVAWLLKSGRWTTTRDVHLYLCLLVFLVHCLVEYPHAYAYFLVPVGLMAGALTSSRQHARDIMASRGAVIFGWILLSVAIMLTSLDYYRARENFMALRYERARVGTIHSTEPPRLLLLTQLSAVAAMDRFVVKQGASDADADLSRKTAERFPAERTLMQYAAISAGRLEFRAAETSLIKLCKLYPADRCAYAAKVWKSWGESWFPWVKSVPFPVGSVSQGGEHD